MWQSAYRLSHRQPSTGTHNKEAELGFILAAISKYRTIDEVSSSNIGLYLMDEQAKVNWRQRKKYRLLCSADK